MAFVQAQITAEQRFNEGNMKVVELGARLQLPVGFSDESFPQRPFRCFPSPTNSDWDESRRAEAVAESGMQPPHEFLSNIYLF